MCVLSYVPHRAYLTIKADLTVAVIAIAKLARGPNGPTGECTDLLGSKTSSLGEDFIVSSPLQAALVRG